MAPVTPIAALRRRRPSSHHERCSVGPRWRWRYRLERGMPVFGTSDDKPPESGPIAIPDAHANFAFSKHPTTIELGAGAYAGVPVTDQHDQHDQIIGVACVIDVHARQWKPKDLAALPMAATLFAKHLSTTANA